jgi:hypothetical protein
MRRIAALALPLLALAVPASAGPLAPTRPSQVVTLLTSAVTDSACGSTAYPVDLMRIADGSVVPFEAPPKQVFVVTSMEVYGVASEVNRRYRFALLVENSPPIVGGSLLHGDAGLTDAAGNYAASVVEPTGVVVPPGALLCSQVDGPSEQPAHARVHGFFTKNK